MRASAVLHLRCELISVRVFVAIGALLRLHLEDVVRALALMAPSAGNRLMFSFERKFGSAVLLHGERGWPEAMLVVASGAVNGS